MTKSVSENLALIEMLISDLTVDLAKENQAENGTEQHDAWMQVWGNVQRLQQLKENLDEKRNKNVIQCNLEPEHSKFAGKTFLQFKV